MKTTLIYRAHRREFILRGDYICYSILSLALNLMHISRV